MFQFAGSRGKIWQDPEDAARTETNQDSEQGAAKNKS
jgi:hypothetical protein